MDYATLPASAVDTIAPLFNIQLSDADKARMLDIGAVYSKVRAHAAAAHATRRRSPHVSCQHGAMLRRPGASLLHRHASTRARCSRATAT